MYHDMQVVEKQIRATAQQAMRNLSFPDTRLRAVRRVGGKVADTLGYVVRA